MTQGFVVLIMETLGNNSEECDLVDWRSNSCGTLSINYTSTATCIKNTKQQSHFWILEEKFPGNNPRSGKGTGNLRTAQVGYLQHHDANTTTDLTTIRACNGYVVILTSE